MDMCKILKDLNNHILEKYRTVVRNVSTGNQMFQTMIQLMISTCQAQDRRICITWNTMNPWE